MKESVRTFIAITIPDQIRKMISDLQIVLKTYDVNVKWVRTESIHITLKFLGDVQKEKINDISQAVENAASGIKPFEISVDKTGVFPGKQRPRVLWVGVEKGSEKLAELAGRIDVNLQTLGFEKEQRRYSGHLTIGRVRSPHGIQHMIDKMMTSPINEEVIPIKDIIVMKSDLQKTGAVYTPLHTIKLQG